MKTIQMLISDLLANLKEQGIRAKAKICVSDGKIVSFEIKILGYTN